MRLFAQLSWYFRREWRRYLGAVALLIFIAILQLIPPKVVGYVVDGVTQQHYTTSRVLMWIGTLVVVAIVTYLLRYVWRVLLFGASYQLAVELREDFYRQLSRQHPEFYLRHRTGDLMARATNDVDRVVFAAGEGVLTLVDSLVMGCVVVVVRSTPISWQRTMIWPMLALAWMFNIVERGSAAYTRIRDMLAEAPVVSDGSESLPDGRGELAVAIREFRYPLTDSATLSGVNFTLNPGQMLGICGPTGAGKSTLLSLIQRHFDVDQGEISYHGIPLPRLKLDVWRSRLAVVNQTPFLFSDTVANNIALGKPGATQQEIEHAARLASVHEDILRLPQGYETEVGERGVMLSGGQKQRISIARALLLNAEILILDDALSAVDGRTEHEILHNLRQWGEGRTVIISAHRLSALTEASEILVMQQGHVAQRGHHDQLSQQPGWYRDMYRYQQLEAALDDAPDEKEDRANA